MIPKTVFVVTEPENSDEIFGVYDSPEIAKEQITEYHKKRVEIDGEILSVRMLERDFTTDIVPRMYDISVMVENRPKEYQYSAHRTHYYY